MKTEIVKVDSARFMGFPDCVFEVRERRSLTVHIEDAGMYDVFCDCPAPAPNFGEERQHVYAGRYDWTEALMVRDGLNRILRALPHVNPADALALATL